MADAKRDNNQVPTLIAISSADGVTPVILWADPITHRLLVDLPSGAGTGTVTSVSIVTANGISGSVATATTTPAITLTLGAITPTTVNGLTLAAATVGFTISGGTTSKTLTVPLDASVSGTNTGDQNLNGYLLKSEYNANTILYATTDNTPVALTVGEQTIVGRITGGEIKALSIAEVKTLLGAASASGLATLDVSSKVVQDPANATATPTASKIPIADGSGKLNGWVDIPVKATGAEVDTGTDDAKFVTAKALADQTVLIKKSLFDANTILAATTDNTPAAVTIAEQKILGRATGGNITALDIDSDLSSVSANDDSVPSAKATKTALDAKLALAGGTMTGKTVTAGSSEVGKTYTPATGSQTVALDCAVNNIHHVTGHADGTAITFTIANAVNSQVFIVSILQGSGTVSTIAGWFATVRWAGGSAPTLTATLNKRDTFGFIRTGTNTYDGFIIGQAC
jgi:hypothetical protein